MNKRSRSIVNGLLLIALAVCLVLWKLNVFNLPVVFAEVSTWGLIIAAFMVLIIIHSIVDLSFGGIFLPLAIIAIVFDKPLGIEAITPWIVLVAAFLLTIAFDMIFPKHGKHKFKGHKMSKFAEDNHCENFTEDENGYVMYSMRFGSATKYVRTPNLNQADLSASFGQMTVFFDGAQVPGKKVYIHCQVSFGELDLYIPKEWRVENKVSVSLGDCDDNIGFNDKTGDDQVVCVIDGSVSFGELELNRI